MKKGSCYFKQSSCWLPPRQWLNENLPLRKSRLLVSIIHHSLLPNGISITANLLEEMDTMMEKLASFRPALVNRSSPLLLNNARLQHIKFTKLQVAAEVLRHPQYSPDLVPTDFYFFQNVTECL